MSCGIDPDHETGRLTFLGSGLELIDAGLGQVDRGDLEKSVEFSKVTEVLNSHCGGLLP